MSNSELRIVKGNDFYLKLKVTKKVVGGSSASTMDVSKIINRRVLLGQVECESQLTSTEGEIIVSCRNLGIGTYSITLCGLYEGCAIRACELKMITIVNNAALGNITPGTYSGEDAYDLDLTVQIYTVAPSTAGVPEAPLDGKKYVRQSADWSEAPAVPEIADNLNTDDSTKTLSAKQGKVLDSKVGDIATYKLDKPTASGTQGQVLSLDAQGKTIWKDEEGSSSIVIVDNLTTDDATKALSAKQGKALKTLVDGKYSKPDTGIPSTDLASAVQTSLGKADSAIQSVKTINNESLEGEGNIEVPSNETLRIVSGTTSSAIYEDVDGNYFSANGYIAYTNHKTYSSTIKRIVCGSINNNPSMAFDGMTNLEKIEPLLFAKGFTTLKQCFNNASKLKDIKTCSNWDVSTCTNASKCFYNCSSILDFSALEYWSVSNIIDMSDMFNGVGTTEINLPLWTNTEVTTLSGVFRNCSSLVRVNLPNINTSKATSLANMFNNCTKLEWVNMPYLDASSVISAGFTGTFTNCKKLTTLIGNTSYQDVVNNNIYVLRNYNGQLNHNINVCPFNQATLRAIINGLPDLTGSDAKNLFMGSTNKEKLNDDDIAVATAKNWTIS